MKALISLFALAALGVSVLQPVYADGENIHLFCAEMTEPLASSLTAKQVEEGLVDSLTNVCMIGYQVGVSGDFDTNTENLAAFNTNIADPTADTSAMVSMKDAYKLGYQMGVNHG